MIKNIVFDIGNVILNFEYQEVIKKFTDVLEEQDFILKNIIQSPEWLEYNLIDTGFITRDEAIKLAQDRTNHEHDDLIDYFWNNYNDYAFVDLNVLDLIKDLKKKGYKIFLLSNINPYTHKVVEKSGLFDLVDGYVLSYLDHQIKPYESIYQTLFERYSLKPEECAFIDDNIKNIDTARRLGMLGKKVEQNQFDSVQKAVLEIVGGD